MQSITEYLNEAKKSDLDLITYYFDSYTVISDGETNRIKIDNETVVSKKYTIVCNRKSDIKDIVGRLKDLYTERGNNGFDEEVGDEFFKDMQDMYEKQWDRDPVGEKNRTIYINFYLNSKVLSSAKI
jgi:hypothetical protein